jgi:hypothetical protein
VESGWSLGYQGYIITPSHLVVPYLYNHFEDTDGSLDFSAGDVDLDTDMDAVCNEYELSYVGGSLEDDALAVETIPDNTFTPDDWGSPGKQHETLDKADD